MKKELYIVLIEDGQYYGSFSPLAVYDTDDAALKSADKWQSKNKGKQCYVEPVDYFCI